MATKRRKKKNSAIRMNPNNDKVTITISAPASQVAEAQQLGSDIAMLAAKKDIPNTRGNPRRRKLRVKEYKRKLPKTETGFDNLLDRMSNDGYRYKHNQGGYAIFEKTGMGPGRYTTKRKASMATKVFGNPIHFPKTRASTGRKPYVGRPAKEKWWILDLYDSRSKKIVTQIGKGSKRASETEAMSFVGHTAKARNGGRRVVKSAMLSGPYARKPTAKTKRK